MSEVGRPPLLGSIAPAARAVEAYTRTWPAISLRGRAVAAMDSPCRVILRLPPAAHEKFRMTSKARDEIRTRFPL